MTGVVCWVVIFLLIVSTLAPSRTCHTENGIFIPPVLVNLFEVEKRVMCVSVGLFVTRAISKWHASNTAEFPSPVDTHVTLMLKRITRNGALLRALFSSWQSRLESPIVNPQQFNKLLMYIYIYVAYFIYFLCIENICTYILIIYNIIY